MYYHDDPVYGINIHPEDNNEFLTASDDGKVMLWDIRTSPVSGKMPVYLSVWLLLSFDAFLFSLPLAKSPPRDLQITAYKIRMTCQGCH